MRISVFCAIALAAVAVPAMAEDAKVIHAGLTLRDAANARVGTIDRITEDGSARLIYDSRFVTIPASTLTLKDGTVVTSLTRKEVSKLP